MCDVCDPYTVVLLVDGRLGLLELKEQQEDDEEEAYLELQWPDIEKVQSHHAHNYVDQFALIVSIITAVEKSRLILSCLKESIDLKPTTCIKKRGQPKYISKLWLSKQKKTSKDEQLVTSQKRHVHQEDEHQNTSMRTCFTPYSYRIGHKF